MKAEIRFNPQKVAYYEKTGWEAYYARDWPRAFRLMVALNREEFHMPLLTALAAAMDIVRASRAFAPVDNDVPKATQYLRGFYEKARQTADLRTEAANLAELEMNYWIVHRNLAMERMQHPDIENIGPMVESLSNLHAALFGVSSETAHRSAELRALAAKAVDRITGRYSTDVAEDWRKVENYLQQAYQAVMTA
jgi:hypothetical protein